uniref:Uncharacterized protein n=1 Tax=Thalassia hemprichii TaxID=55496 RepID=A0A4Y1KCQ6_9LILI|nr:hypothetical protein [Thalassia hemprichii]YP_009667424.1 hypothetical protein [Thalassia hemprichii]ATP74967.1 hypothetical protein [Thalassia hemprichii]ATP74981.1 hypothetical protein [Thalassia hemprichii]
MSSTIVIRQPCKMGFFIVKFSLLKQFKILKQPCKMGFFIVKFSLLKQFKILKQPCKMGFFIVKFSLLKQFKILKQPILKQPCKMGFFIILPFHNWKKKCHSVAIEMDGITNSMKSKKSLSIHYILPS